MNKRHLPRQRAALLCLALLVLGSAAAGAGEKSPIRRLSAYRMAGPVTVDGVITEDAWTHLPATTGFYILPSATYSQERQTSLRIGWDDTAIYLGVRCEEPEAAAMAELAADQRGGWGGEALEIFFVRQPAVSPDYAQLMIDANGEVGMAAVFADGKREHRTDIEEHGIRAATAFGREAWTLEAVIPFAALGGPAELKHHHWRFNIGRNSRYGRQLGEHLTTYVHLGARDYHRHWEFAYLKFMDGTLSVPAATRETAAWNRQYDRWLELRSSWLNLREQLLAAMERSEPLPLYRESGAFAVRAKWEPEAGGRGPRPGESVWDKAVGWRYYKALPVSLTLDWEDPATFNAVRMIWFGGHLFPQEYGIEYWTGDHWELVLHERSNADPIAVHIFPTVTTERLRLTVFRGPEAYETLRLRAFDLFDLTAKE